MFHTPGKPASIISLSLAQFGDSFPAGKEPMGIRWPERYAPANTAVFVSNQLEMNVPSAPVWEWLIRADLWS
jgi:hypothetical protein